MEQTRTAVFDPVRVQSTIVRIEVQSTNTRSHLYFLEGTLTENDIEKLTHELLVDPVTDTYSAVVIDYTGHPLQVPHSQAYSPTHTIEVSLHPGVTDPAAENLLRSAHLLGIKGLKRAATGQKYTFDQTVSRAELEHLAVDRYSNPVIQRVAIDQPIAPPFVPFQQTEPVAEVIPFAQSSDERLTQISAERRLALNLAEMQAIRAYFASEKREPTDAELEMIAQTWSEHCVHKTFRAAIDYTGPAHGAAADSTPVAQHIDGLLRTYIRAATERVAKPWLYSAFVDNAGIIAFDEQYDLAFKVETHNHPSALEPFGGANTGVGGVIRDILGVSARPIANTDVLCFGPTDLSHDQLPTGVLHPKRIEEGVVHGVEDYGNKMGIPTVNGAVLYHPGYTANPLVFCGCLGLLPHGAHKTSVQPGDLIVVIGGATGRDGLRGATFSSMEMDTTTGTTAGSAVQIGHPIQEKQVLEVILRLRDENLYHAITDCGAGGLSSAVGEMASGMGAHVQLEEAPLKYPGLKPWEIWLSEAQERMVLAVAPEDWEQVKEVCREHDVIAAQIGRFEASGRVRLQYEEHAIGDLSVEFLHNGIPQRQLQAQWLPPAIPDLSPSPSLDFTQTLLNLLSHPNIRSKEPIIRRYDHEVQGSTAVKPLVGRDNHGPSDASVLVPLDTQRNSSKGASLAAGICPSYGEIDPYAMAWAAVDEAMRNLVAVGTDPDQVAILDNFCWGNPNLPDRLGALVRCAQGCYDSAVAYGVPYISGKDSLNNEYADSDGQRHAIPGTLLISALGIVPDVQRTVTMDLKAAGNLLYIVGVTRDELGGSHTHLVNGIQGGTVPQPVPNGLDIMRTLHEAIKSGWLRACHDCSEGGLAVALAEMCIAGRLGAEIETKAVHESEIAALFSESLCRFIVEVSPEQVSVFENLLANVPYQQLGRVTESGSLTIHTSGESICVSIETLESAWRGVLPVTTDAMNRVPTKTHTAAKTIPAVHLSAPRVLIVHANGTNRDREAALACEMAGGQPEIVHINQLIASKHRLMDYHMLVIPGGFSYGDDLGAGKLWALDLQQRLGDQMAQFVADGRPVLGICNGFQALVKSGLLPGGESPRKVTLTFNESAHFECRWVYLQPNPNSPCLFTEGLDAPIYCPVAHGEGRLVTTDQVTLDALWSAGLAALTYTEADGSTAHYPHNPNGSSLGIAGVCNAAGNVFGLMPHPEDHIFPWQHPRWHRGERGLDGLRLFQNGIKHA